MDERGQAMMMGELVSELGKWVGVAACLFVLVGCICRIDMMRTRHNILGWVIMYILAAPFAYDILFNLLTGKQVGLYAWFGLGVMALHFQLTKKLWTCSPPLYTIKA